MKANEILVALALKNNGNWEKMFDDVKNKRMNFDENVKNTDKYITMLDDEYPNYLKTIMKPPFVLFYQGDISLLRNDNVAYLVKKELSVEQKSEIEYFVNNETNTIVVYGQTPSAMFTIDEAKKAGLKTICVLGEGLDQVDPFIANTADLIITEFPRNVESVETNEMFAQRLVAAFSNEVKVVEIERKSPNLLVVDWALNQGKDIKVMPVNINRRKLCNNELLLDGAFVLLK